MATLEISVRGQFNDTGDLSGYQVSNNDPRRNDFDWDSVRIDLSRSGFVRPAAVLWCTVYSLLVIRKGITCELLAPSKPKIAAYLNDLGMFAVLRDAGVRVDYSDVRNTGRSQLVLPITLLRSISEVEDLENSLIENLEQRNLSSTNLHIDVAVAFAELGNNAVEHAQSPIDAYGLIQYYGFQQGHRFVCAIADGGIGVRASLQKNLEHKKQAMTDWRAIEYAIQENTSGTSDRTRGMGLHHIVNDILPPNRELNISSGTGFLHTDGKTLQTSVEGEQPVSRDFSVYQCSCIGTSKRDANTQSLRYLEAQGALFKGHSAFDSAEHLHGTGKWQRRRKSNH